MSKVYQIAVIGGGSAGTMAALRTVLNNDECLLFPGSGKDRKRSRAFWVAKVENMPGHLSYKKAIDQPNKESIEWIQESEFKDKLHLIKNRGVESISKNSEGLFELTDSKGEKYLARFVVLCTGVMDVQPEIDGSIAPILPFANTQIVDYCIRCDGHHVLNKRTSIIGHDSGAAWVSIILKERYDCPEMTILTNGKKLEIDDDTQRILDAYDIKVVEEDILEVVGDAAAKKLDGYKLKNGEFFQTDFSFVSLGMIVYNKLALDLGADVDERGFVVTNEKGLTSVDNLYVAGDLRAGIKKQIYTAWDSAVDSVDSINSIIRREKRAKLLGN